MQLIAKHTHTHTRSTLVSTTCSRDKRKCPIWWGILISRMVLYTLLL